MNRVATQFVQPSANLRMFFSREWAQTEAVRTTRQPKPPAQTRTGELVGLGRQAGGLGCLVVLTASVCAHSREKNILKLALGWTNWVATRFMFVGRLYAAILFFCILFTAYYLWRIFTGARVRSKGSTWICHFTGTDAGK